jgi:hypothetical protein
MVVMATHVYGPEWGWPSLAEMADSAVATAKGNTSNYFSGGAAIPNAFISDDIKSAL